MEERLQKILAQARYCSCRAYKEFITAGRVRVNGQVAKLGQKTDPARDKITLEGKALPKAEGLTSLLCTSRAMSS
jgi:23S rRNA pseudouridine2605 synthase